MILSLDAMATRFEVVLYGSDPARLRAAGEEALQEVERLEAQLSFYCSDSEIRFINESAAARPIRVEPRLFTLLHKCAGLSASTAGAFDITVGPLMRAWRFVKGHGAVPDLDEIEAARSVVGIEHVELDQAAHTVRFRKQGVEIDLGAYGKGYAIERAIALMRENGIASALLHGGTSSVYAIGAPAGDAAWRIRLSDPIADEADLVDCGLSVSAVHGKFFERDGKRYGHVVDPRTGHTVTGALAAAVVGPSPADCEALSTALLVLGECWLPTMAESFPGYRGWVAV